MPTPSTLSADLLSPVRPENPGGDDLYPTTEWLSIREARPDPYETGNMGIWAPQSPTQASWRLLRERAESALLRRSKDLRIATLLAEAHIHLNGFAGLRDSLQFIRELLVRYWDSGLYPLASNGDLELRSGALEWLNAKLSSAILEIPLAGKEYSYLYFEESRRPNGIISREEFASAVEAIPPAQYRIWYEDLQQASTELAQLEEAVQQRLAPDDLLFSETEAALAGCRSALENIIADPHAHAQHN